MTEHDQQTTQIHRNDEIRVDEIHDGKLMFHIDADDPEHPLEKKAWLFGIPVEVRS